jgi:diguanylate cyclase (GGDEF)-like protein
MFGNRQRAVGATPAAEAEQLRFMKRVSVGMVMAGGLMTASGVLTTSPSHTAATVRLTAAAVLVAISLTTAVLPARRWFIEGISFVTMFVLGGMVATLDPIGMVPFFYLWPVVYVAYFSSTRTLVALLLTMAVTLSIALIPAPGVILKSDTLIGALACVGLMGTLVAVMQYRERRLRVELEVAADTDPLTGLLNRRALNPTLAHHFGEAATGGAGLCLILVDVDHFKRFNDTHGHVEGDLALQRLAAILRAEAAPGQLVGRFGGEEFAVVMPAATVADARAFVGRVSGRLSTESVAPELRLTVSAGIAEASDPFVDSLDRLLVRADQALYAAKDSGRDRPAWWLGGELHSGSHAQPRALAA